MKFLAFPETITGIRALLREYSRKDDIEIVLAEFSPKAALTVMDHLYLDDEGVGYQRNIRPRRVAMYARVMRAGNWSHAVPEAMFLRPDDGSYLVNGYHTLTALMESGIDKLRLKVQFNTPLDALTKIDQIGARTITDSLAAGGFRVKDPKKVEAVARMVERHERGLWPVGTNMMEPDEMRSIIEYVGVEEIERHTRIVNALPSRMRLAVFGFCDYYFSTADATDSELFFDALASGRGAEAPIHLLRERLLFWPGGFKSKTIANVSTALQLTVDAFNKFRRGDEPTKLQLPKGWDTMNPVHMKLPSLVKL